MDKISRYRVWRMVCLAMALPRNALYCLLNGVMYDFSWRFYGLPYIRVNGIFRAGHRFKVVSSSSFNSIGVPHKAIIIVQDALAKLIIGEDVGLSGCVISASCNISIGDRVIIGSGAMITDSDAHTINPFVRRNNHKCSMSPVIIENDVFIGARAIILKGVTIGTGSVVGAGAVVTRNLPPYSIAVGNPAKIVGDSRMIRYVNSYNSMWKNKGPRNEAI